MNTLNVAFYILCVAIVGEHIKVFNFIEWPIILQLEKV